jgi:hypothetical protein
MKVSKAYIASCGTSVDNAEQLVYIEMKNLFKELKTEFLAYVDSVKKVSEIQSQGTKDKIEDFYNFQTYMPTWETPIETFMESVDSDIRALDTIQTQVTAYQQFLASKKLLIQSRLEQIKKFVQENPL